MVRLITATRYPPYRCFTSNRSSSSQSTETNLLNYLKEMNVLPAYGLGTWKIPPSVTSELVYESIREGIRAFDCACDYGNEQEVGKGIRRALEEGICSRQDLVITSKLWNTYHAKEHVEEAIRKTLLDLQLEYLDLYLIHFPISLRYVPMNVRYPPEWIYDPQAPIPTIEVVPVPIRETWEAMESLVDLGLTKHIGLSNFNVQTIADILSYARIPPSVLQVELHPYLQQQPLIDYCHAHQIQVTAYSPLGSSSYIELTLDKRLGVGVLNEVS